ncbi:MAG: hypothetical protein PHC69_02500 [Ruminiclostridium sp.]|nr:hypothetical protein [Ruminiclostridium sp.]
MGSVTTWYAFVHNLDYIAYFMPMSGDCWVYGMMGGGSRPNDTAKYLHDAVVNSGYDTDEYYIYGSVGAKGVAYEPMDAQVEAMREYTDTFIETDNFANGNFHFDIAPDGTHDYEYGYRYI